MVIIETFAPGASLGPRRPPDHQPGGPFITRHDPLVQTAAPHRWPTGWFVPGAPATLVMHANLINTGVADAQLRPGGHPTGGRTTRYAEARAQLLTRPNRKSP